MRQRRICRPVKRPLKGGQGLLILMKSRERK